MSYNRKLLKQMTEESKQKKSQSKPKDRIVDPMGQWNHPGEITRIPSNRITMQGVPYPVLGIGNNGQQQMMYPGQEYVFPGSNYVDEFPLIQARNGGEEPTPLDLAKIKARMALESHFGNPSARRMTTPYPQDLAFKLDRGKDKGKMGYGTHWMGDMGNYAVPFIQEDASGKLFFKKNASPRDREAMRFNTPEEALMFAENYKEVAPMSRNNFRNGGESYLPKAQVGQSIGGDPTIKPYSKSNPRGYVSMKNNKDWFDNHANWTNTGNSKWDDHVRKLVLTGRFGVNPETGALIKIPESEWTNIPQAYKEQASPEWGKKTIQERFKSKTPAGKEMRKAQVASSMKEVFQNPITYAPAAIAAAPFVAGAIATSAPIIGAALTTPIAGVSGLTASNALAAYGITDFALNRAPQLPGQIRRGEYADAAANIGFGALDLFGANMVSPSLFKGAKSVAQQTGRGLINAYDKVATGNSFIPYAWKMEKSATGSLPQSLQNLRNLTDEEARVLNSYLENPYNIKSSPEDSKILESIMKKNYADLSGTNKPITRIQDYYVSEYENPRIAGSYGETVSFPQNEGRSWSLGRGRTEGYAGRGKQRLVIPSKYAKQLEGFHAIDYADPRLKFNVSEERELFGNVPEGFKVIGKSNEEGFQNIFLKPKKGYGGDISIPNLEEGNWLDRYDDGGPVPAYLKGPMRGDIQMRGNVNIPTQVAYDISKIRQAQAAEQAARTRTTIGPDTRTAGEKQKAKELYEAKKKYEEEVLGKDFNTPIEIQEKNRRRAEHILHLIDVGTMGAGLATGALKAAPRVGKYLTTQTPLKNAYKINPWAFKPNPEAYYRVLGKEGVNDALESGIIRANPKNIHPFSGEPIYDRPFFSKGVPFDRDWKSPFKNKKGKQSVGSIYPDETMVDVFGHDKFHKTGDLVTSPIDVLNSSDEGINFYKRDWLRGYKPINTPKQLPGSSNTFKSEIDWGKWNPDTPKYPELINEYNAIEESTKKAGTWMKNPDGSPFQGTPEQFIQQQSSWFKKAFPNILRDEAGNIQKTYHGSQNTFDYFDPNIMMTGRTRGSGIYTSPIKERAATYATKGDKKLYEFYQNANNPQNIIEQANKASDKRFKDFLEKNPKGSKDFDKKFDEFMKKEDELYSLADEDFNLKTGYDFLKASPDEYVVPFTNYPKSAVGNVGFFDMTNPNIYKGLVPTVLGGAAATAIQQKKKGGQINWLDKYN